MLSDTCNPMLCPTHVHKDEDGNVKPVRQVPREYEGDYIVKLPVRVR